MEGGGGPLMTEPAAIPPHAASPAATPGRAPRPAGPGTLSGRGEQWGGVRARRGPVPPLPPPPSYIEPGRGPRARESHRKSRESSRRDGEEAAPWDERGRGNARSSQWELERRGGQVSRERA